MPETVKGNHRSADAGTGGADGRESDRIRIDRLISLYSDLEIDISRLNYGSLKRELIGHIQVYHAGVETRKSLIHSIISEYKAADTPEQRQVLLPIIDRVTADLSRNFETLLAHRTEIMQALEETRTAGRPFVLTPEQQAEAQQRHARGESMAAIARSYDVSKMTIFRLVHGVSQKRAAVT